MEILFNYIVNFGIKIYRKMPRFLTIQKPDLVNRLSVSSFAATIKPPPFDDSNYKRWRERLILWLTALRMMHVKEDKPEKSLQRKGVRSMRLIPSFEAASLVFSLKTWYILISGCQMAMHCGMLLRLNMECLMLAVSCM